jgi:SanA protein
MKIKNKLLFSLIFLLVVIISLFCINAFIITSSRKQISDDIYKINSAQTGIILGARVYQNQGVSQIVYDRLIKTIELYNRGIITKILISGDHGTKVYDEVNTIKKWLLGHNVPEKDIFMDHAGFNTYDSMYRAKSIFQVNKAIIITQKFHLPRALYIAKSLGIDCQGYTADRVIYKSSNFNDTREFFARIKAFIYCIIKPKPKYLGEIISIEGDGSVTQD